MRFLLLLSLVLPSFASDTDIPYIALRPFKSDGCSLYPDGSISNRKKWVHCCEAHDLRYWTGGTKQERLAADKQLRECVVATGERIQAEILYFGARTNGGPSFPTNYRWGFGWSSPRPYGPLTPQETNLIQSMYPGYPYLNFMDPVEFVR